MFKKEHTENMLEKIIIAPSKNNIERRTAIWNMVSSILGAAQSAIFLLVVTHVCDAVYAGIFSIATTLGYQIIAIGSYGMRNFQATDVKQKYKFKEYLLSRYFTSIAMFIFLIGYVWIKDYNTEKALIILAFGVYKAVDVIEDVFHGEFQRYNRLDIGAISMTIRYVISFLVFAVVLITSHNLLFACICEAVISILVFIILTYEVIKPRKILSVKGALKHTGWLLRDCFPLFIGGFLYLYVCNAPKYAIDNCLSQESQMYFAILFMPVFVVNLLSSFVYRPLLVRMAICWNEKRNKEFWHMVMIQIALIFVLTILGILGAYLCGTQILSLVYGVDVNPYRNCLVLLMFGGGFAALIGFLINVLTVMRLQTLLLLGYMVASVAALIVSNPIVSKLGIFGASILYVGLMVLVAAFLLVSAVFYKKKK